MSLYKDLLRQARTRFRASRAQRYDYRRLVEVCISRKNLLHNVEVFARKYAPTMIAPVLKSNAYGHGLVQAARVLEAVEPPFLVVEGYYEALILRNEGITVPILVMGYTATENIQQRRLTDVAYTLVDHAQLLELAATLQRPLHFHLKVDTGMRRYGIQPDDLPGALAAIRSCRFMHLEGACSHMAKTTAASDLVARKQIESWNRIAATVRQHYPGIPYLHLASTGGSYWSSEIDANIIRLGLGCYGFDNSPRRTLPLKPALSVTSTIGAVRTVAAGAGIGYGHAFVASRDMKVATVVSGYDACVDIRLSNRGAVLVHGHECPIVGRVCMNGVMIDISAVSGVRVGDTVTLISSSPGHANSVANIAQSIGTSQHVVLTGVSSRLRRVIT